MRRFNFLPRYMTLKWSIFCGNPRIFLINLKTCSLYLKEDERLELQDTSYKNYNTMAKTKEKKLLEIKNLEEQLAKMKIGVFTAYDGLKVKDLNFLRRELGKEGLDYKAVKKSLLKFALKETGIEEGDLEGLKGSIGLAFGYVDEVTAPKVLNKFQKDHKELEFLGALLDKKFISKDQVIALAKIPGRQELLGQFVGVLKAPVSGFAQTLRANLQGLVNALNQIKDKANA
jgi:large subunit ribosomal protein L10